jgi:hypothetical protein
LELLAHRVPRDPRDLKVRKVILVHREQLEPKVLPVPKGHKEILAPRAHKARKELKGQLVLKVPKVMLAHKELQELRVQRVHKET